MRENRIRELRLKLGFSQTQLACKAGIASPTLSQLENGKVAPWPKIKRVLARILKVTQQELFMEGSDGK